MAGRYITYETLEEGRIARITLNRVQARNAQNRGLLVELDDAFLAGRGRRSGAGGHPGRSRTDVLLGPRPGLQGGCRGAHAGSRTCIRVMRSTGGDAERSRAAACCRSGTTSSRTPCAGGTCARSPSPRCTARVFAAGLMLMWACDLIVAADDVDVRRRGRHSAGHVRRGVLRPPVGVRTPQDQGAHADRGLARRRGGAPAGHGLARSSLPTSSASETLEFAAPHRRAAHR